MNIKVKLGLYAVLLILAVGFAWGFHASYASSTQTPAAPATNETPAAVTNSASPPATASESSTNPPDQNGPDTSNATAAAPPVPTNVPAATTAATSPPEHGRQGAMIGYLAALIGTLVGLGIMIAHDVTQFLGNYAVDALLDVGGEGERDPDYEKAEQAWAKGKHMDAINLLREFLEKKPRAQYAALRIAEIYEKDLNNPVAASLEYEEILKQKLPDERWGWAAVHLCNLYSKLNQQDKARDLLKRIADEYPNTAAAKKARSHLGLPEAESEPIPEHEGTETAAAPGGSAKPGSEQPAPAPAPPKSNLPPGFRPKT
ncbi:MAG: tetratricopeptide repeat protein [Limisphaerales bacterium]